MSINFRDWVVLWKYQGTWYISDLMCVTLGNFLLHFSLFHGSFSVNFHPIQIYFPCTFLYFYIVLLTLNSNYTLLSRDMKRVNLFYHVKLNFYFSLFQSSYILLYQAMLIKIDGKISLWNYKFWLGFHKNNLIFSWTGLVFYLQFCGLIKKFLNEICKNYLKIKKIN